MGVGGARTTSSPHCTRNLQSLLGTVTTYKLISYMPAALGWSFMFMCAYYDRPKCLVELLILGADPNLRSNTYPGLRSG